MPALAILNGQRDVVISGGRQLASALVLLKNLFVLLFELLFLQLEVERGFFLGFGV